jgi:hypothetical protein
MVKEHNARREATFKMSLNEGADVESSEREYPVVTQQLIDEMDKIPSMHHNKLGQEMDPGVDWSKTNYTSPVIRQGDFCNAGWAISAASCLETALSLRKNESEVSLLSVQYIVGCDLNNDGCAGGNQLRSWKYIQDKGYYFKGDYYHEEYLGKKTSCMRGESP